MQQSDDYCGHDMARQLQMRPKSCSAAKSDAKSIASGGRQLSLNQFIFVTD
jgi:hypothetical protein